VADESEDDEEDIEAAIAKEIKGIHENRKTDLVVPLDLNCMCVVFVRTRKPVDPVRLVMEVCEDAKSTGIKKTRYALCTAARYVIDSRELTLGIHSGSRLLV
jgi:tRNA acetyltransferase TAN1